MTLDVSIIIVNWNTRDVLRNCLSSVYRQTQEVTFEIILIDNASTDGSVEMVRNEFPQVKLIENQNNRGFAAANNQGMTIAHGRYILLLNPDTILLDKAIQKSIAFADQHPDAAVIGCQVRLNENEIQPTCFSFPSVYNLIIQELKLSRLMPRLFGNHNYAGWNRSSQRDVDVISGMFMFVRHEAIEQVGLMDEDYFVYAEETDWCYRFKKSGWRRVFTPTARIIHCDGGSKSTEQISLRMFVQLQKSLLIFHKKQLGWLSWMTAKTILIVSMFLRYIFLTFVSFFAEKKTLPQKKAQSQATLKFLLFGVEPNAIQ